MIEAAGIGILLGLSAGFSPGPLLGLVVLSTLRGGAMSGCRVALSPLLTDLPIVLISLTLVSVLPGQALTALSLAGGVVVIGFGIAAFRDARQLGIGDQGPMGGSAPGSLWRGAMLNALSPHPWLFWTGVGAPIVVAGWRESPLAGAAFLVTFYLLLVGSKSVIAFIVGAVGNRLSPRVLRMAAAMSGVMMIALGAVLLFESFSG